MRLHREALGRPAAVATLGFLLAGCGNNTPDQVPPPPPTAETPTLPTETPTPRYTDDSVGGNMANRAEQISDLTVRAFRCLLPHAHKPAPSVIDADAMTFSRLAKSGGHRYAIEGTEDPYRHQLQLVLDEQVGKKQPTNRRVEVTIQTGYVEDDQGQPIGLLSDPVNKVFSHGNEPLDPDTFAEALKDPKNAPVDVKASYGGVETQLVQTKPPSPTEWKVARNIHGDVSESIITDAAAGLVATDRMFDMAKEVVRSTGHC